MEQKNITDGSIAIELNLFILIGYVFSAQQRLELSLKG